MDLYFNMNYVAVKRVRQVIKLLQGRTANDEDANATSWYMAM